MQVRQLILTASALVIAGAGPARAQDSARVPGDSALGSLVAEALARNPTVAQRQAGGPAPTHPLRTARSLPAAIAAVGGMGRGLPDVDVSPNHLDGGGQGLEHGVPW